MKRLVLGICIVTIAFAFSAGGEWLYASAYTVNSTTDAVDASAGNDICATAGAVCTLRAAVQEANAHAGTDVILIPAGTYTLSVLGSGEDASATGDLDTTGTLSIQRTGSGTVQIVGSGDRVFHVVSGSLTLSDLIVRNGSTTTTGGGILNAGTLTLNRVIVKGNSSIIGGGGVSTSGTFNAVDCTVSGNSAPDGAGILTSASTTTLTGVTLSGNTASTGGGGAKITGGTLQASNSTFSGNSAPTGGGVQFAGGTSIFVNVTIANNTSANGAGISNPASTLTLYNTLIADNNGLDCSGAFTSGGNNLVETTTGCATAFLVSDVLGQDPKLKPLGFYGGVTQTHNMKSSSPATDAGDVNTCTVADQRGLVRSGLGATCDIGAVEFTCISYGTHGPTDPLGPGDVENIDYDPNNLDTLYVAWNDFGVYKTTDMGATWTAMNSGITGSPYVDDVAVDPGNTAILYAATSTDVFKSVNGGASWNPTNTGVSNPNFSTIVVNPKNSAIVYVGSYGSGIYKSTDSGATWNPKNTGISPSHLYVTDLKIDPTNPQILYFSASAGSMMVYHTANGGDLWTAATVASGNGAGIAVDESTPTIVYAAKYPEGVMKSTDSGLTWNAANTGIVTPANGMDVAVDPRTSSVVYATIGGNVYRSSDAGATWERDQSGIQENSLLAITVLPYAQGIPFTGGVDSGVFSQDVPSLYCDDFEDGDVSDWTASGSGSSWTVPSGDLTGTTVKKGDILAPFTGCVTCSVDTDISYQTGSRPSLHAWYVDKKNRVELMVLTDKGKVVLKHKSGGVLSSKAKASVFLQPNTTYHFNVQFDGTKFTVVKDGSVLFTMKALTAVGPGTVGYRVKSPTGASVSSAFREVIVH